MEDSQLMLHGIAEVTAGVRTQRMLYSPNGLFAKTYMKGRNCTDEHIFQARESVCIRSRDVRAHSLLCTENSSLLLEQQVEGDMCGLKDFSQPSEKIMFGFSEDFPDCRG